MRRRFRRKPRVVWLRPTGTVRDPGEAAPGDAFEQLGAIVLDSTPVTVGAGGIPTIEIPLVVDQPPSETFAGAPLSVLQAAGLNQTIEYGYRLRRVVGAIHLACSSQDLTVQDNNFSGVLVTAGLIVRRVESDTGTALAPGIDVNPALITNWSDPWIWRRTWVLTTDANSPRDINENILNRLGRFGFTVFPYTTDHYGDIRSGPHVDAKTARRIGPEERLFLDISFIGLPLNQGPGVQQTLNVSGVIDLRCLATVFTNSGNRRNASR